MDGLETLKFPKIKIIGLLYYCTMLKHFCKQRSTYSHSANVMSDFVSDAVVGKSVKLLKQYGLKVF